MDVTVRDLTAGDDAEARALMERVGVEGYFEPGELARYVERSTSGTVCCALGAFDNDARMLGFRLTLPPGTWSHGRGREDGLTPEQWPAPLEHMAYFQSCFVDPVVSGRGIGTSLSREALRRLASLGALGALAHSWKESPHDSSRRALRKLGFVAIAEHEAYWSTVPHACVVCGFPCRCTAVEMALGIDPTTTPPDREDDTTKDRKR